MSTVRIIITTVLILSILIAFFNGVFLFDKSGVIIDTIMVKYIDSDETHSLLFRAGAGILFGTFICVIATMVYLLINYGNKYERNEEERKEKYNTNKTMAKIFNEYFVKYVLPIFILIGIGLFSASVGIDMPKGTSNKYIWINIGLVGISLIFIILLSSNLFKKNVEKNNIENTPMYNFCSFALYHILGNQSRYPSKNMVDLNGNKKDYNYFDNVNQKIVSISNSIDDSKFCDPKEESQLAYQIVTRFDPGEADNILEGIRNLYMRRESSPSKFKDGYLRSLEKKDPEEKEFNEMMKNHLQNTTGESENVPYKNREMTRRERYGMVTSIGGRGLKSPIEINRYTGRV